MALDPNIALGVRPLELANPLAQYGQVAQIQAAQQAQQMNALKMQEYQRNVESQNALRGTLAPEGVNPEHWKIDPKEALALAKTAAETKNLGATYGHLTAQTNDLTIKALGSTFDNFTKLNPPTVAAASPEGVAAYMKNLYADPLLGAVAAKQMPLDEAIKINTEGWAKDPKAWATAHMGLTGEKLFDTLKGTRQNVNQGGTSLGQTVDAYGRVVPGSAVNTAMTATPGELLANKIAQQRVNLEGQRVDLAKQAQTTEGLNPKEIQKREAALPQATAAIKGFETKSDSFVTDLQRLRDHPGLSQITGLVAGRVPAVTADGRAAQALYDKVVAKGGFQALQDMRDASKTGGALGNVSNQEGKQLTASFAAIQRTQDAKDVRAAIDDAVANIQGAKTRMREAYDSTYSYKTGNAPASGGVIDFGSLK